MLVLELKSDMNTSQTAFGKTKGIAEVGKVVGIEPVTDHKSLREERAHDIFR